jgi:hypothetical protein
MEAHSWIVTLDSIRDKNYPMPLLFTHVARPAVCNRASDLDLLCYLSDGHSMQSGNKQK